MWTELKSKLYQKFRDIYSWPVDMNSKKAHDDQETAQEMFEDLTELEEIIIATKEFLGNVAK